MKHFVITSFTALFIVMLFTFFNTFKYERWVILNGCTLKVAGSTNINKFVCEISEYATPDTINQFSFDATKKFYPLKGNINIDVAGFNCHNPLMTNDLRKTIKSKEFPKLKISFVSLKKLPDYRSPKDKTSGIVDIEMSGVIKRFEIDYEFNYSEQNVIHVIGVKQINFSDFNLIPPRKLGGMIKTNNELLITFDLRMKSI